MNRQIIQMHQDCNLNDNLYLLHKINVCCKCCNVYIMQFLT